MLYPPFDDHIQFKELFGIIQHSNGVKSRKNLILLKYIKTAAIRKLAMSTGDYSILDIKNMAQLKKYVLDRLTQNEGDAKYELNLINYNFHSNLYSTDSRQGSCIDGDLNSIRYIKHEPTREKEYKMKAGKLLKALINEHPFGQLLPEQVVVWLCEEFTMDWASFSGFVTSNDKLHIDKNFKKIYDSTQCEGNFGSCMVNRGYHRFYTDYVNASAAYLENPEGKIIARCVIFNEVLDEDDKVWRYAERQYSSEGSDVLKRTLIDSLIRGGHIDCYKQIGAGCSDSTAIVDIYGNSLADKQFRIACSAQDGDTVSYQDTFKWLSVYHEEAYNTDDSSYDYCLDHTYGTVGGDEEEEDDRPYDEYHDRHCDSTVTVYYHGQEISCDEDDLDDFVCIGDDYIHHEDVLTCPECGIEFDKFDHDFKSELTGESYCCQTCKDDAEKEYKEEHWHYSEYDNDYFEHEDDLTSYMAYDAISQAYTEKTISKESYDDLLDNGDLYWIGNNAFDKLNPKTNLPFGYEIRLSLAESLKLFNKNESVKEVI